MTLDPAGPALVGLLVAAPPQPGNDEVRSGSIFADELFRGTKSWMMPADARHVLRYLAGRWNLRTGQCNPGKGTIAEETSIAMTQVKAALAWLEKHRWITVHRSKVSADEHAANQYDLHIRPGDLGDWATKDQAEAERAARRSVRCGPTSHADVGPHETHPGSASDSPLRPHETHPGSASDHKAAIEAARQAAMEAATPPSGGTRAPACVGLDPAEADGKKGRKSRKAGKTGTGYPEDFEPNDADQAVATKLGLSLDDELAAFSDNARAKGLTYLDWHGALRTWLRYALKFGRAAPPARPVDAWEGRSGYGHSRYMPAARKTSPCLVCGKDIRGTDKYQREPEAQWVYGHATGEVNEHGKEQVQWVGARHTGCVIAPAPAAPPPPRSPRPPKREIPVYDMAAEREAQIALLAAEAPTNDTVPVEAGG